MAPPTPSPPLTPPIPSSSSPTPPTGTSWPSELRPIAKYLARAEELADTHPTVAFGCRLTALSVALATPGGALSPGGRGGGGGGGSGSGSGSGVGAGGAAASPASALLRAVLATAEAARSAWVGPVPLVTAAAADTRALVATVISAADADLDARRGGLETARAYYAVTVLIDVLGCLTGGGSSAAATATTPATTGGTAPPCRPVAASVGAPTADRARYAVAHIMKALADGGPAADGTIGPPPASAWAAYRSAAAAAGAPGASTVAAALAADATVEPPVLTAAADLLGHHREGKAKWNGGAPSFPQPPMAPTSPPPGAAEPLLAATRATKKAVSALDFGDAPAARRCLRAALRALDGVGRGWPDRVDG